MSMNPTPQSVQEEIERTLLHLRAGLDDLEPVLTIGRMMIAAYQSDPALRDALPVVVVSRIEDFLKVPSTVPCQHLHVTDPVWNGGNYGHHGTQRCLDCGAVKDAYSDWTKP